MDKEPNNKTGYEWLDDAFDDDKAQEELQRAQAANNRGCLIAIIVFAVAIIAAVVAGLSIITAAL